MSVAEGMNDRENSSVLRACTTKSQAFLRGYCVVLPTISGNNLLKTLGNTPDLYLYVIINF